MARTQSQKSSYQFKACVVSGRFRLGKNELLRQWSALPSTILSQELPSTHFPLRIKRKASEGGPSQIPGSLKARFPPAWTTLLCLAGRLSAPLTHLYFPTMLHVGAPPNSQ